MFNYKTGLRRTLQVYFSQFLRCSVSFSLDLVRTLFDTIIKSQLKVQKYGKGGRGLIGRLGGSRRDTSELTSTGQCPDMSSYRNFLKSRSSFILRVKFDVTVINFGFLKFMKRVSICSISIKVQTPSKTPETSQILSKNLSGEKNNTSSFD